MLFYFLGRFTPTHNTVPRIMTPPPVEIEISKEKKGKRGKGREEKMDIFIYFWVSFYQRRIDREWGIQVKKKRSKKVSWIFCSGENKLCLVQNMGTMQRVEVVRRRSEQTKNRLLISNETQQIFQRVAERGLSFSSSQPTTPYKQQNKCEIFSRKSLTFLHFSSTSRLPPLSHL